MEDAVHDLAADDRRRERISREEGFAEGEAYGAQKNAIENAKNALAMGLSAEQVAQITSLPLEQVLALEQVASEK